jgi:hypothetical protein
MYNFCLYNPLDYPRSVYHFLVTCFVSSCFYQELILSFESAMASSSDDKGKGPREEDPKLKEEQEAGKSRARNSTFVGSMNAGRAFSHDMRGQRF